jgi:tetratricopeptide (TPR) repeat protein
LGARVANALIAYASYIGKMLWPVNLAIFYPHPIHPPLGSVLRAAVLLAAVTVVVLRFGRRRPYLLFGWLWYLGMLVPVIGLVQVGSQAMADRYTYLPLIGLFVMLVWGLSEALGPRRHQVMAAGAGLALASCALLTTRQLGYWQDNDALFGHALAVTPNNFLANENLGLARLKQGRVAEAIVHLSEAARLAPRNSEAQKDLGSALLEAGQFEEAIIHLRTALELKPGFAEAEHALGSALFKSGRMTDAIAHFRQALAASPDLAEAHNNLGDALRHGGQVDEAITHFQAALALQPDNAIACNNLGAALRQKGQLNEAITQFRKALALRPDSAETHNNLANALGVKGQVDEAILHFQTALRLQPNNATIRDNFGRVLLLSGRVDEAVGEYRAALELQPADAEAWATLHRVAWVLATCPEANRRNGSRAVELARQLDRLGGGTNATTLGTLAAAYAEAGSFDEAAASVQKALRLAVANTNTVPVEPFQAQLAAYQTKAPWRDPTLARPGGARKPE